MSDVYAMKRFHEALHAFEALEEKLRNDLQHVDEKKIDAVLIDLGAVIPGLDGEDLGRALVYKGYVTLWRIDIELSKKLVYDPLDPVDPRLVEALNEARRGRGLLQTPDDIKWAEKTVKQLEEYTREHSQ